MSSNVVSAGPRIIIRRAQLDYPLVRDRSSIKSAIFGALGFNTGPRIDKKVVHAEDDELSDVAPDEDEHELPCIADGAHSELDACLERADGLIFDVWELSDLSGGHALSTLALHLFRKYNLFSTFGLNMEKVPRHALQLCGGCSFGRLLRIRQSRRS